MADDVRRSGRANKGHHTKNADALDEPVAPAPKPKGKSKPEKKAAPAGGADRARSQSEDQDEEGNDVIRCVCGDQRTIRGREMICCDNCQVWQHNRCLNLPEGDYWEGKEYFCEQCKPEQHVDLLAAMERGEKPWNRKKGQKPPKSRPSDVIPPTSKSKASTPAPAATPPPAQAAQPQTRTSPAPVNTVVAKESTTKTEAKASKKEAPKSQPQSPVGEKRRNESVAEKDHTNKKRRKSSAQQPESVPTPTAGANQIEALPAKQKVLAERLRDTLVPLIEAAVADSRGYQIPDGETSKSLATQFALQIDHAALQCHGEPVNAESPFSHQLRSIIFNIKKNTILIDRLLTGGLSPEEFASMAPELMASEEKQREYAAMREANEKQMVLTEEPRPRLRKTHKGEEVVGEDYMPPDDDDYRVPPPRDRELDATEQQPQSPSRDGQMTVELPEDVGRPHPLAVDTSSTPVDGVRRPSAAFDINSVFDKVRSPQHDQPSFIQRRQSSIRSQDKPQAGPGTDPDVDRLLKDEENDVEMSDYRSDPSIVWQGSVSMQTLDRFDAVARFVAGGDFGQVVPWERLLAPTLSIQGRIESAKGDEYIRGCGSTNTHDVCVLALSPVLQEGKTVIDNLYKYFAPRNRWGVVPMDGHDVVKDLYVIPIEPGGSSLPPFLDMLAYCTIETPRKEPMMLLALVGKLPDVKPSLHPAHNPQQFPVQPGMTHPGQAPYPVHSQAPAHAPHPGQPLNGPTNGPGPSPSPITNPHAPSYSPVNPTFPHTQYPQVNPPHHNGQYVSLPTQSQSPVPHTGLPPARISEILGQYMNSPTLQKILSSNVQMTEDMMLNLRAIMDEHPEAMTDVSVLSHYMTLREREKQAQGQAQNTRS